tara:strand:- start:47 stop:193 length:147 start_codon:yes stop_codon:yes gene_type:complete
MVARKGVNQPYKRLQMIFPSNHLTVSDAVEASLTGTVADSQLAVAQEL